MNLIDMFAASDYNDSTFRDRPSALFISDQIITDFRTRRDAHALVNDRASNPAMPPNVDIIKQNGFADVGIAGDIKHDCLGRIADGGNGGPLGVHLPRLFPVPQLAVPKAVVLQAAPHLFIHGHRRFAAAQHLGIPALNFVEAVSGLHGKGGVDVDDPIVIFMTK